MLELETHLRRRALKPEWDPLANRAGRPGSAPADSANAAKEQCDDAATPSASLVAAKVPSEPEDAPATAAGIVTVFDVLLILSLQICKSLP